MTQSVAFTFVPPTPITCSFTVYGEPVPCGRPRSRIVIPKAGKPFIQVYADPKSKAYEELIGENALWNKPPGWRTDWARYDMRIRVYQSGRRGDLDNFWKAVADGCQGVLWDNDRHIATGRQEIIDELAHPRLEVLASMVGDLDIEQDQKRRTRLLAARRMARR